jgi:polyhydroxyalkanoate synthesis regulator phasin
MSVLKNILPNHSDPAGLDQRAAEINAFLASGNISTEEHRQLLEDLVRTAVIAREANQQNQKILLDQCVKALSMIPIP